MRRLRDIGEARIALEQVEAGDTDGVEDTAVAKATRGSRRVMLWLGLGLVVGIALGWAFVSLRDSPPVEAESGNAVRFSIRASAGNREIGAHVPAADDRYVVYEGSVDGTPWLFLHDFASGAVRRLEQTSGAVNPFLSPDGRWVGFHRGTDLMKLRLAGGDAVKICDVASGNPGADWGADGTILFPRGWLQGLWTVSADGGEPVVLTEVNAEAGEKGHWWPRFLPDGRHALFTIWNVGAGLIDADVALLDVASGEYRTLVPGADAHFLPPGQIVFYRAGSYHAIDFDPVTLEVAGDPLPVLESATDPAPQGTSDLGLAISHRGTLFYNTRQVYPASRLAIVEPGAAPRVLPFPSRSMVSMSLSPDGRSLVVASLESGLHVLRMLDLQNGTGERIALSGSNWDPQWKPDGSGFAFLSLRKGDFDVYFKDAGTGGPETPIQVTPTDETPVGWTADGSAVLVRETPSDAKRVLKAVPVDGSGGEATTIGNINASVASVSPHGDWLVYDSLRAGVRNIYVRPYPGPGPEVRVSPRGGRQVAWSPDGTELYYAREDSIVAVSYTVEDGRFQPGKEEVIFQSPLLAQAITGTPLAVLGRRRFVVALVESEPGTPQLEVVLNWNREVRERLAARTER